MKKVTIKDIARICNVGVSTVSRAMNDDPGINAQTKERILATMKEYNYTPNGSARNLKRNEANTIALLVKGIDNPFFNSFIKYYEEAIKKYRYSSVLYAVREEEDELEAARQLVKDQKLKGILFLGGVAQPTDEALEALEVPYVLCTAAINMNVSSDHALAVSIDDEGEARRMVDYLIKMGHKRIALIPTRASDISVGFLRVNGYKKALEDNGLEFDPQLVRYLKENQEAYTPKSGYEAAADLLDNGPDCTAIFAISDTMALGVYKAIQERGLRIPEDISVVGFDGLSMCEYLHPGLTTIIQPAEQMLKSSLDLLIRAIEGEGQQKSIVLAAEFKENESVKNLNI